jgi:four helix bundle protein
MEYTKRKNLNRGYMKLEAWQRGMDLFALVFKCTAKVPDYKLRAQIRDAAQSVSANIAEGYCRRSLPEYIQYLYIAKGSLGECLTRSLGLARVDSVLSDDAEKIDSLHYEVENILLGLIRSLEQKWTTDSWEDALPPALPKSFSSPNR